MPPPGLPGFGGQETPKDSLEDFSKCITAYLKACAPPTEAGGAKAQSSKAPSGSAPGANAAARTAVIAQREALFGDHLSANVPGKLEDVILQKLQLLAFSGAVETQRLFTEALVEICKVKSDARTKILKSSDGREILKRLLWCATWDDSETKKVRRKAAYLSQMGRESDDHVAALSLLIQAAQLALRELSADVVRLIDCLKGEMNCPERGSQSGTPSGPAPHAPADSDDLEILRWLALALFRATISPHDGSKDHVLLTVESPHPYPDSHRAVYNIRVPGSKQIRCTFDPQCRTESVNDVLAFYSDENCAEQVSRTLRLSLSLADDDDDDDSRAAHQDGYPGSKFSGSGFGGKVFEPNPPTDEMWLKFTCDDNVTAWGFKIYVTAEFEMDGDPDAAR
jgi:hypothetical protein